MDKLTLYYKESAEKLLGDSKLQSAGRLPSQTFYLEDGAVLALPRDDGDSRYPYGQNGFNFWTYASGYMHSNEGLFSPFLRATEGGEPKIAFFASFIKEDGNREVVSLLSVPIIYNDLDVRRFTIFTSGATYYYCQVKGITFSLRVVVDINRTTYFSLSAVNESGQPVSCQLAYYMNPFVKNALVENSVDRWFRQVTFHPGQDMESFVVEAFEEVDRSKMAPNLGVVSVTLSKEAATKVVGKEITTSRYRFVGGARSSLHTPEALYKGTFGDHQPICAFTETAIASGLFELRLDDQFDMDLRFEYGFDQKFLDKSLAQTFTRQSIDEMTESLTAFEAAKLEALNFSYKGIQLANVTDETFNHFTKHVMKQVEFCSIIKGYIQLSSFSLIGIRDVFQALEALIYYQPQVAKEKMLEALNFMTHEGRCPRQYILPTVEGQTHSMDLRPFIDQGVWVISTIVHYLRLTNDFDFLNETCGYYEFIDEHKHLARKAAGHSSVLTHMMEIMDFLLRQQDLEKTNCIYALYGDWNDALDGLGKTKRPGRTYGTGVSVMATLQVKQNCDEMIDLLNHLEGNHQEAIEFYQSRRTLMVEGLKAYAIVSKNGEKRILHGWGDEYSYTVGGFNDPDGKERDGVTSNAFWLLADMPQEDTSVKEAILKAFQRLDSKYGLKTFHPHFEKDTEGIGRIPNLPAGTAENGATYIHASLFGVMALFKAGESRLAWEALYKLMPITHKQISVTPFVMPNSYGDNEALFIDGESMSDWQTGSSNVFLKLLIRYVVGIEVGFDTLTIQPANYQPASGFDFTMNYQGKKLYISYKKATKGNREFFLNGERLETVTDSKTQMIKVCLTKSQLDKEINRIDIID